MIASPVAAADLPLKAPALVAPAVASWTQFYVGAGIGFDFATGRSSVAGIGGPTAFTFDGLQGADLGLSAFAGLDVQVGQVVVGAFVDYDRSNQKTTLAANSFGTTIGVGMPSLDQGWTIGARAGVLVTPDVLLYGLAGYSEMKENNWSFNAAFGGVPFFAVQETAQTVRGYTVGFGAEYRVANNVSLRGEYRYVALGSATTVDTDNGVVLTNDLSEHLVRVSAAYRFGQFGSAASAPVQPARMATPSWTGVYVGAGLGADAIAPHVAGSVAGVFDLSGSGLGGADVGGTFIVGYDRQVAPNWVVGAFGLIDAASNGGATFKAAAVAGGSLSSDLAAVKWGWTVGGRAGYLVTPNTLVYVLAGYSGTTLHAVTYDLLGIAGTGPTPEYHGATFGGGFERFFTAAISARAEYRVTHLGTLDNLSAPGWDSVSAGGTVHTLRAVLAYHLPTP